MLSYYIPSSARVFDDWKARLSLAHNRVLEVSFLCVCLLNCFSEVYLCLSNVYFGCEYKKNKCTKICETVLYIIRCSKSKQLCQTKLIKIKGCYYEAMFLFALLRDSSHSSFPYILSSLPPFIIIIFFYPFAKSVT